MEAARFAYAKQSRALQLQKEDASRLFKLLPIVRALFKQKIAAHFSAHFAKPREFAARRDFIHRMKKLIPAITSSIALILFGAACTSSDSGTSSAANGGSVGGSATSARDVHSQHNNPTGDTSGSSGTMH